VRVCPAVELYDYMVMVNEDKGLMIMVNESYREINEGGNRG